MPTSGTVILPVRTRASVSCSAAKRRAQRGALRRQRARHRRAGDGAERGRGGDLLQLDQLQVVTEASQRRHERTVRRLGRDDAVAQLDEQPPVAGARRLAQGALVADVRGEQHRDDVEVRRQLVAQVPADLGGLGAHRQVDEQRRHQPRQAGPRRAGSPCRGTRHRATGRRRAAARARRGRRPLQRRASPRVPPVGAAPGADRPGRRRRTGACRTGAARRAASRTPAPRHRRPPGRGRGRRRAGPAPAGVGRHR